jgi:hypothetical protein
MSIIVCDLIGMRAKIMADLAQGGIHYYEWIRKDSELATLSRLEFNNVAAGYKKRIPKMFHFEQINHTFRGYPVRFYSWYTDDCDMDPVGMALGYDLTGINLVCIDARKKHSAKKQ